MKEPFPEFITPWFLRRVNYGPCKAGDIVDLLRFLRPNGQWLSPFQTMTVLDPYLSATLEKSVYPNVDTFAPSQELLLRSLYQFIFSAYNYAQGVFFPFDGEWEEDKREAPVDSLDAYVDDMVTLIDYILHHGRETSLRNFVRNRTQQLQNADRKRTFFFAEGGDTRIETEEYVLNMFLALLGLWTVGSRTSDIAKLDLSVSSGTTTARFDYSKNLPYLPAVIDNISLIRETFGVLVTPVGGAIGMDWVRPLHDFDASVIARGPFHFALTRDISRHLTVDSKDRVISLFCEEAVGKEDSLSRLEGNIIAT
jgi:hypothetical protein